MAQKGYIKNSVTADLGAPELAAIFKGILPTNGIINLWDDLACARINDNLVRLSPGIYNLSGYLLGVMQGTTADLAVDSGTAGYNRKDLVVAEFVRNGGGAGVDTLQFKIVKGTSVADPGVSSDPTLTADDINSESNTTRQEALYRLSISGTTMAAPELMADSFSVGQEFEMTATNIKMDGTQSLGTLETVPRADHVHPTDTSRAPLASPALTGTPTAPTAAVGTNTAQLATTAYVVAEIPNRVPAASTTVAGKVELATSAEASTGTDTSRAITPSGLRGGLNATGTAPIYACRAWVDFNGTGTVAIRESGNVSSITDGETGIYTVNFTTAMEDANYCALAACAESATSGDTVAAVSNNSSTSSCHVRTFDAGSTLTDALYVNVAIFR